ncbi:MAG: NAD(P)H-dependent glycerol-3-phosphate dehydrogenase [Porticoccaceae bacterium]|nr:NAD(P)H-dependent glycerol-3-phosphate dehydrogenase [Pseudomonadales bacterium]MCP5171650.1 NAD(P)H-dependent glycerol-3-phosphate dehydrogenase [Pseudomonadales bacterium]
MAVEHRVAVLGGGSFGTAIANLVAANNSSVILWMRDPENAERCLQTRENSLYLPGVTLNSHLEITADLATALTGADIVFFSVPSKAYRPLARQSSQYLAGHTLVISAAKGIESETCKLMTEILHEELPKTRIGLISGPNLAREIAQQQITATVVASKDSELCSEIQHLLSCPYFRVYASHDPFGVELAGTLKNIYAIIAGIAAAMNMGQNTISVLITRSLAEMSRYAAKLGANPMTFLGLGGVGDLFVSCTSPLSRNYQIGYALGQGLTLEQAIEQVGQVAEGVNTTRIIKARAEQLGIYMPLVNALYNTMFEGKSIKAVLHDLMLAEQTNDVEFIAG